jgi:acetyl esterase/lipase
MYTLNPLCIFRDRKTETHMKIRYTLQSLTLAAALVMAPFAERLRAQDYFVSSTFINTTPAWLLGLIPGLPATYNVDYYRITYNTVDTQGQPTVASGAVGIPKSNNCNVFPMMVYCHGTVLRQTDVPSFNNSESAIVRTLCSTGYIALAPDYLGLGVNPGIHPYVHAESQATATIDLIYAAREFLETLPQADNGEVFITGYSQGGHAAMATLKYAQDNNLLDELGIVAGAPCSGPYHMSGPQAETILSDAPYSNPGYIVYLLVSYQLAYGNLYTQLSDVIQSPYAEIVAPYFDGAQDTYNMSTVNALLPAQVSELLVDTVLTNFTNNPNHPLWVALRDNDNYDWNPQIPLRLYYCSGDEQVAFENSTSALAAMQAQGATNVQAVNVVPGATHGGCVVPALVSTYNFFSSLSSPCSLVSSIHEADPRRRELGIWPNPTRDLTTIYTPGAPGIVTVYDLSGRAVMQVNTTGTYTELYLGTLGKGYYLVQFNSPTMLKAGAVVVE